MVEPSSNTTYAFVSEQFHSTLCLWDSAMLLHVATVCSISLLYNTPQWIDHNSCMFYAWRTLECFQIGVIGMILQHKFSFYYWYCRSFTNVSYSGNNYRFKLHFSDYCGSWTHFQIYCPFICPVWRSTCSSLSFIFYKVPIYFLLISKCCKCLLPIREFPFHSLSNIFWWTFFKTEKFPIPRLERGQYTLLFPWQWHRLRRRRVKSPRQGRVLPWCCVGTSCLSS